MNNDTNTRLNNDNIGLNDIIYYLFLIPIGLLCNTMTFIIVVIIMRNRRSRQSIPDACICFLTGLDVFSILFIHLPIFVASLIGFRISSNNNLSFFLALSTAFYLKFQFLIQVTMSLDRFFAITSPLNYNRLRSFTRFKIVVAIIMAVSVMSTAALFIFNTGEIRNFSRWNFSYFQWHLRSIVDYVVNVGISLVFLVGFVVFLCSNGALVRFFYRYDSQKSEKLLCNISNIMKVVEKRKSKDLLMQPGHQPLSHVRKTDENTTSWTRNNKEMINGNQLQQLNHSKCQPKKITSFKSKLFSKNDKYSIDMRQPINIVLPFKSMCSDNQQSHSCPVERRSKNMLHDAFSYRTHSMSYALEENSILINENPSENEIYLRYNDGCTNKMTSINAEDQCVTIKQDCVFILEVNREPIGNQRISLIKPTTNPSSNNQKSQSKASEFYFQDINNTQQHKPGENFRQNTTENRQIFFFEQDAKNKELERDVVNYKSKRNIYKEKSRFHEGHKLSAEDIRRSCASQKRLLELRNCRSFKSTIHYENNSKESFEIKFNNGNGLKERKNSSSSSSPESDGERNQSMLFILERIKKLMEKTKQNKRRQRKQLLLLKCVLFSGFVFIITWLPFTIVAYLVLADYHLNDIILESSMKLIFSNALFNCLSFAVFRENYRKGFQYITITVAHMLTCRRVAKPSDDLIFYESKNARRRQHFKAAEINRNGKMIHSSQLRKISRSINREKPDLTTNPSLEFYPSKRLQQLFDRCPHDVDDDFDSSSDIDYDALIFQEENIFDELINVWSQVKMKTDD